MPPENNDSLLKESLPQIPSSPTTTQPANNQPQPNLQTPIDGESKSFKKRIIILVAIILILIISIASYLAFQKFNTTNSSIQNEGILANKSNLNTKCIESFDEHLLPATLGAFGRIGVELSDPVKRDIESNALGAKRREISANYLGKESEKKGGLYINIVEFKNTDKTKYAYVIKKNIESINVYFTEVIEPGADNPNQIYRFMAIATQIPEAKIRIVIQQIPSGPETAPLTQADAEKLFNEWLNKACK